MLKSLDGGEDEARLVFRIQEQLNDLGSSEYRVLEPLVLPVESGTDRYIVDGWTGTRCVEGTHELGGKWSAVLDATKAFHRDLKALVTVEPDMFKHRTSPWARADRVAWDDDGDPGTWEQVLVPSFVDLHAHLLALKSPLALGRFRNQIVHLDLMGNILVLDNAPPTIIDLSLYWRPVEYAEAIFVVDGLTDEGASNDILLTTGPLDRTRFQMLVRAMIFRVLAWSILALDRGVKDDPVMAAQFSKTCSNIERVFGSRSGI